MSLSVQIVKQLREFPLEVSFETEGGALGLLGASGCGKSMTLKCIAGVERPDRGRIVLNGRVLFDAEKHIDLPPQKRQVGYLFQQYALFPNMTVEQNIAAGAWRLRGPERAALVARLTERFRLTGLERQRPARLSGGQQQRVALARILAGEPELLLLDEPFTALDGHLKWQLELELLDMLDDFGGPTLLVSHDQGEVRRLCGDVCVLSEGRSQEKIPVEELFRAPSTVAACRLIGAKNLTRVRPAEDGRFFAADWGAALRAARPLPEAVWAAVRESALHPVRPGEENVLACTVERLVEDLNGPAAVLRLENGAHLRMTVPAGEKLPAGEGEPLRVGIRPEDVLLLKE